jgi:tetratricopeptide (TPR) repeat protein/DNA-binding CsgD family transcriptional regulator
MDAKITEIDALISQAEKIKFSDFNKCLELGGNAYQLAKEIDYPKGKADGLFFMGLAQYSLENFQEALSHLKEALSIYKAHHDRQGVAKCLLRIGTIYYFKLSFDEALEDLQKSLEIFNAIGDKKGQISAKGNIANIYSAQEYDDLALQYYLDILKTAEEINDKRIEAITLFNIGKSYSGQIKFGKALDYFLKSLEIFKFLKDEAWQANMLMNIGSTYIELNQPEKSLLYITQSNELRNKIGLDDDGYSLMNMGRAYEQKKDYENALSFFNKSEVIFRQMDDREGQGLVHVFMGKLFLEKDDLEPAIGHFTKTIDLLEGVAKLSCLEHAYWDLSIIYKKKKRYKKALEYFEKYDKLHDEIFNKETEKQVLQLQTMFEVERKEKENEMYRLKVDQQNKELALLAKNIKQKNKLLQELHKKISNMDKEDSLSKEELVASILSYLKKTNTGERAWHIFEDQVDKIYPGFISHLCNNYPDLTRQELRVCALLRLDLSSKEIANTLFVATRTIEIYRTRIRKKLNLSHKTPLKLFLSAL